LIFEISGVKPNKMLSKISRSFMSYLGSAYCIAVILFSVIDLFCVALRSNSELSTGKLSSES